jgi:hypothetical protein
MQETLEQAAERHQKGGYDWQNEKRKSFIAGAKWQAERMYSEEEVKMIVALFAIDFDISDLKAEQWFEQNKKA